MYCKVVEKTLGCHGHGAARALPVPFSLALSGQPQTSELGQFRDHSPSFLRGLFRTSHKREEKVQAVESAEMYRNENMAQHALF